MRLDRRRFLGNVTAALALPAAVGAAAAPESKDSQTTSLRLRTADGGVDWRAVRALFDLDRHYVHLSSFFLVSHPRPVREAIEQFRHKLDINPLWLEEALFGRTEAGTFVPGEQVLRLRRGAASHFGVDAAEIAWVPNTTTGLALVYNGLKVRAGQEILTTTHDHYAHHEAIRLAVLKNGAAMRRISLYDQSATANEGEVVERVRRAIGPRTRAVGVTWVHSSTGVKLPIAALAEVVRAANAGRADADRCLLIVDGVHGLGVEDTDISQLGADFFSAGLHKWVFAPRGTGMLWGRADAWKTLWPTIPTFDTFEGLEPFGAWAQDRPVPPARAAHVSPGGFIAYEHLFAIPAALDLHQKMGRSNVAARIRELNLALRDGLAAMRHVRLHTPRDPRLAAGIVCFEVHGLKPDALVERLHGQRILATSSPYPVSYARLAAGVMNEPGEIERALSAVRALAAAA